VTKFATERSEFITGVFSSLCAAVIIDISRTLQKVNLLIINFCIAVSVMFGWHFFLVFVIETFVELNAIAFLLFFSGEMFDKMTHKK